MEWACRQCGRTYHEAPEGGCRACGHPAVVPAKDAATGTGTGAGSYLDRLHSRLFDPGEHEVDLLAAEGLVSVAFRLIAVVSLVLLVAVGVAILL